MIWSSSVSCGTLIILFVSISLCIYYVVTHNSFASNMERQKEMKLEEVYVSLPIPSLCGSVPLLMSRMYQNLLRYNTGSKRINT